jgi:F0F1-type ATP synthase assembly protein I
MSPGKTGRRGFLWSGYSGARHAGIGLEFAGAVAGFALLGYWVDRHYATQPWGLVGGVALGFLGGLYNFVKQALQAVREAKAEDAENARAPGLEDRQDGD